MLVLSAWCCLHGAVCTLQKRSNRQHCFYTQQRSDRQQRFTGIVRVTSSEQPAQAAPANNTLPHHTPYRLCYHLYTLLYTVYPTQTQMCARTCVRESMTGVSRALSLPAFISTIISSITPATATPATANPATAVCYCCAPCATASV
jgi:hypothetical protein